MMSICRGSKLQLAEQITKRSIGGKTKGKAKKNTLIGAKIIKEA